MGAKKKIKKVKRSGRLKDFYTWKELMGTKTGQDAYEEFKKMRDIGEDLELGEAEALKRAKQTVVVTF